MRKYRLLFVFVYLFHSLIVCAQHKTLHEEFTGENCPPCAATNPGFWSLCDTLTNPSKLIHITYMEPIPSSGTFYLSSKRVSDARVSYYSVPFAPYGRYDGHVPDPTCGSPVGSSAGHPGCFTQADIDLESAIGPKFSILAYHTYSAAHDSVNGTVVITADSDVSYGRYYLRVAFTKTMNFAAPPGYNGETHFENVVRKMFPPEGIKIDFIWAAGTSRTYTYSDSITGIEDSLGAFSVADSGFVVWVQNDSGGSKTVMAAARSALLSTLSNTEPRKKINVFMSPNPASDFVAISGDFDVPTPIIVTMTNMLGTQVRSDNANLGLGAPYKLTVSDIPSGVYIISVDANGLVSRQQLTIIR